MTDPDTFGRFRILAVAFLVILIGCLGAVVLSPLLHEPHAPGARRGRASVTIASGQARVRPEVLDQPVEEVAVEPTSAALEASISFAAPDADGALFVIRADAPPATGRVRLHLLAQAGVESAKVEVEAEPALVLTALGKALSEAGFSAEYDPESARQVRIHTLPSGQPVSAVMLTLRIDGAPASGRWSVGLAGRSKPR